MKFKLILNSANFRTLTFLKNSDISFRKIGISKSGNIMLYLGIYYLYLHHRLEDNRRRLQNKQQEPV